jgi:hypothetical protein
LWGLAHSLASLTGIALGEAPDAVAVLSFVIGMGITYFVPPSAQDIIDRMTNDLIRIANAHRSDVTAVIVDEETSERVAKRDVALGLVPPPPKADPA